MIGTQKCESDAKASPEPFLANLFSEGCKCRNYVTKKCVPRQKRNCATQYRDECRMVIGEKCGFEPRKHCEMKYKKQCEYEKKMQCENWICHIFQHSLTPSPQLMLILILSENVSLISKWND